LAPLEWTLCWLQDADDDAEDWLERALDPPLEGRADGLLFPLEWLPPAEAVPLRLPLAPGAAFMPLWAAEEGRALEDVRELDGRDGRLLDEDCPGLWSRELDAGRLKWGRAATDFLSVVEVWTAAVRGAWLSAG
jgi:hypothetical protein